MRLFCVIALWCAAASGCALLGKSEPPQRRYFTPEGVDAAASAAAKAASAPPGARLRLGRVSSWSHLRERMVTRTASRELTYSETRRWTERPEVYLRRALEHALFEERGFAEVAAGPAASLEVDLAAFEEVQAPRRALVQALLVLRDEQGVTSHEMVTISAPLAPAKDADDAAAVVDALSRALHEAVERIADRAVARLGMPVR